MSDEKSTPPPPPNDRDYTSFYVICLLVAFLPSLIGILCFNVKNPNEWSATVLVVLNLVCSVVAGVGLVRGIKDGGVKFTVGFFLIPFFFVLNAIIVIFVGCSGGGRIAP
jgi:hypothetical protein